MSTLPYNFGSLGKYAPERAIDGFSSTYWSSRRLPYKGLNEAWWKYRFANKVNIQRIELQLRYCKTWTRITIVAGNDCNSEEGVLTLVNEGSKSCSRIYDFSNHSGHFQCYMLRFRDVVFATIREATFFQGAGSTMSFNCMFQKSVELIEILLVRQIKPISAIQ